MDKPNQSISFIIRLNKFYYLKRNYQQANQSIKIIIINYKLND